MGEYLKYMDTQDSKKAKARRVASRVFTGLVVSDKMEKTLVVVVNRVIEHQRYGKRYSRSKRYKVHDERSMFHAGDMVNFRECRPLSRDKRWRVIYPKV